MEEILFHLIDLDVLLAPSGKEADAAKKVALREALAKGPLLSWFGGIEARPSASAVRYFGSTDARCGLRSATWRRTRAAGWWATH